jgi:hypothetical protein
MATKGQEKEKAAKRMIKRDDYVASLIANLVADLFWQDDMDIKAIVSEMVTGKNREQQENGVSEEEEKNVDALYDDLCERMEKDALYGLTYLKSIGNRISY